MSEDETNALLRKVEQMSHEDMARAWRFAPVGSPYFADQRVWDVFNARWQAFRGWNPELSKRIGWDTP
jgi:hypothetical protein